MCVVSMVGDHYSDKWRTRDWYQTPFVQPFSINVEVVTRDEFERLKAEVAEMVALLKRAKKYDADNHEPDCELEEKMVVLRSVAKLVGVNLDEVLAAKS